MNFCTFASGSSGNCTLVWHDNTYILIDAGISMRRIANSLRSLGLDLNAVSAVLVTHEHSDHINGLNVIMKHYSFPVYASGGTARAVRRKIAGHVLTEITVGAPFAVGALEINSFETPHDTAESVGYTLNCGRSRFAYATDLGHVSPSVLRALNGADAAVLESNHDIAMLKCGSYPYRTKQRILGNRGHLSNEDGAELALALAENGTKTILLAHLSRDNNRPDIALGTSKRLIEDAGARVGGDVKLHVAPPDSMSAVFSL